MALATKKKLFKGRSVEYAYTLIACGTQKPDPLATKVALRGSQSNRLIAYINTVVRQIKDIDINNR